MISEQLEILRNSLASFYAKSDSYAELEALRLMSAEKTNLAFAQVGDIVYYSYPKDITREEATDIESYLLKNPSWEDKSTKFLGLVAALGSGMLIVAPLERGEMRPQVRIEDKQFLGVVIKWFEVFDGEEFSMPIRKNSKMLYVPPQYDDIDLVKKFIDRKKELGITPFVTVQVDITGFLSYFANKSNFLLSYDKIKVFPLSISEMPDDKSSLIVQGQAWDVVKGRLQPLFNKVKFGKDVLNTPIITVIKLLKSKNLKLILLTDDKK